VIANSVDDAKVMVMSGVMMTTDAHMMMNWMME
jgi:hypothetical protein